MSLIPRYLVNNRTTLVANVAGFVTEYRPVYQQNISVYKGIENTLEFQILNPDQKPIGLTNYTAHFVAFDAAKNLVIQKAGDVTIANKGLFKVSLSENDTLNLDTQYLSYSVYLTDSSSTKTLTYADEQLNAKGTIYLTDEVFPGPKDTTTITNFNQVAVGSTEYVTDVVTAEPGLNGNEALHTVVFYTNGYVGTIAIEVTLDNDLSNSNNWSSIDILSFTGTETQPTAYNFNGIYTYLRFKTSASPDNTITKILLRN
jgi:hypothetical protein